MKCWTGELPLGRFRFLRKKAHTDPRLDQVVLRALEKEPERRYQQAGEILARWRLCPPRPPPPSAAGKWPPSISGHGMRAGADRRAGLRAFA